MGKLDKDRYLKELALRYSLASGGVPFLEVVVSSASDLSDSPEVLTDLDALAIYSAADGSHRATIFDCKSSAKMSAVNRAFWAAGVKSYTGCYEVFVLLKNRPVHNHRISALTLNVDLHDEQSLLDLGRIYDVAFPTQNHYQSNVANWDLMLAAYEKHPWSAALRDVIQNQVPLTNAPWATFRRVVAELKAIRGQIDPAKNDHIALYLDCVASLLVLWSTMARDVRRFYDPKMTKAEFEKVLRYYLWGGRESYGIRQKLREAGGDGNGAVELPAWAQLVALASKYIAAPQQLLATAVQCREVAFRKVAGPNAQADIELSALVAANSRFRQFASAMSDYGVAATGLPKDLGKVVETLILNPTTP